MGCRLIHEVDLYTSKYGKSSELCFDNVDYVFLFRIMFSNSLNYVFVGVQIMFGRLLNYVLTI